MTKNPAGSGQEKMKLFHVDEECTIIITYVPLLCQIRLSLHPAGTSIPHTPSGIALIVLNTYNFSFSEIAAHALTKSFLSS